MMKLKTERLLCGWSQAELARRAQLNANTVSQIESGRFRPYEAQLRKLALALGVPEADASSLLEQGAETQGSWSEAAGRGEGWQR